MFGCFLQNVEKSIKYYYFVLCVLDVSMKWLVKHLIKSYTKSTGAHKKLMTCKKHTVPAK